MIISYDRFLTGKSSEIIDYKNIDFLRTFITVQGKVI
jgi:Ribosomal protein S18.